MTRNLTRRGLGACLGVVLVLAVMALGPAFGLAPSPASGVEVVGDDERDLYSGSGSVILPSSISASVRHRGASCPGCRWKVTMPCLSDDDHQDAACRGILLGCPQGREIKRAWLATAGGDFEPVGLFCPSDGEAVSVAEATATVRGSFINHLPALRPVCQPPRGAIVGIGVHCRSGQPSAQATWQELLVGYRVRTQARAHWRWTFHEPAGAVASAVSSSPGRPYPEPGVRHTFSSAGGARVTVQALWDGQFFVDDLGPFPIEPNVTQQAQLQVPIASAMGVLRP